MPESPTDKTMLAQAQTRLPLNGLKVLDLTLARAGPTAVRHLADWGADVIKIEPPATDGEEITGNRLRHEYDTIDLARIWLLIQRDLPPLKAACEHALRKLSEGRPA